METGYDPVRIGELARRVRAAIDALASLRSDDPVAAEALRAVRLTRQNLEDQWMPLLQQIEASTALVRPLPVPPLPGAGPAERTVSLLRSRPWFDDLEDLLHLAPVIAAITAVADDPQACLEVLSDPVALLVLAQWDLLPDDLVEAIVIAGLHTAIIRQPDRLAEGYAVLRQLTILTNGPLDGGVTPGFARGVAMALRGYLPTLAPAIRHEGTAPVVVVDVETGLDVELGSYDDVVDLIGVLLREPVAQAALGVAIGGYVTRVVDDLGSDLTERPGLEHVARFADLVADASRTEQAELVIAAAAEEAQRRQIGDVVGFGVGTALVATGAGAITQAIATTAIEQATDRLAGTDAATLPDLSIAPVTYDLVTVATLAMLIQRPAVRATVGLGAVRRDQWEHVDRHLVRIERTADRVDRMREVTRLDRWIEHEVPALAGYLRRVRATPGLEELTEQRPPAGTD